MNQAVRKEVLKQLESLFTDFCEGCFIQRQLRKEGGKRLAHRFCISQCTVGEKIKEYGKKLGNTI
ncbi:zinc-finger domain-containing protein [Bacillus rubiinfantis]|uniref:zinc-finger domain-containing protein n=1 Tax=Bacillus rubiinfantis TaxID=1499680 RepID=UPI0005AB9320|nr:zinc-finger domain-containing protein [Bacillus rubiinfantis]